MKINYNLLSPYIGFKKSQKRGAFHQRLLNSLSEEMYCRVHQFSTHRSLLSSVWLGRGKSITVRGQRTSHHAYDKISTVNLAHLYLLFSIKCLVSIWCNATHLITIFKPHPLSSDHRHITLDELLSSSKNLSKKITFNCVKTHDDDKECASMSNLELQKWPMV